MQTSFDPATHTYRIDGERVPSVTQILRDLLPGWTATEWHLQRGTAVHACAALVAQGKEFTADPQIAGEVEACRRFFREVKPEVVLVEVPLYEPTFRYAGTADAIVRLNIGRKQYEVVLDWKATLDDRVTWQLAGYAQAYGLSHGVGVELRPDGTYRMSDEVYDLRMAKREFLAMRTTYGIRERVGLASKQQEGEK